MWLEVFKTGIHTDSRGNQRQWTEEDLNKIVETYNNQPEEDKHDAPIVIGHPATDSPAYGWVEKLERRGKVLYAKVRDLAKEFVDWVKKGLYKKRSIALYDNLLLKHVGFLGGVPPAVKGLADPQFDEGRWYYEFEFENVDKLNQSKRSAKYGIEIKNELRFVKPEIYKELTDEDFADPVHYKFPLSRAYILASLAIWSRPAARRYYSEEEARIIASRLLRSARNHKILLTPSKWEYSHIENLAPTNEMQKIFSQIYEETKMDEATFEQFIIDLLGWLGETFGEEVAAQTSVWIEENKPPANESKQEEEPASVQMKASDNRERQLVVELQKRISQLEMENRLKDFKSYAEQLIRQGKLFPAQENIAISLLELGHKQGITQYAESNKVLEIPGVELVKKLLESYPEVAMFQEQVKKTEPKEKLSEFRDFEVDRSSLELHLKATNYMEEAKKSGKNISYKEALSVISRGQ